MPSTYCSCRASRVDSLSPPRPVGPERECPLEELRLHTKEIAHGTQLWERGRRDEGMEGERDRRGMRRGERREGERGRGGEGREEGGGEGREEGGGEGERGRRERRGRGGVRYTVCVCVCVCVCEG